MPTGSNNISPATTVNNAISAWNTANAGVGGSGTKFEPATANTVVDLIISVDTDQRADGVVGQTTAQNSGIIDGDNQAHITLYPNSTSPNLNGALVLQPSQPNYSNALTHAVLHELAHVQGACDYNGGGGCAFVPEPWPGPTVLDLIHGVNDGQTIPPILKPTACDVTLIASTSKFTRATGAAPHQPPISKPPTGQGGGTGAATSCGGGSYFDSDTNTVYGWC